MKKILVSGFLASLFLWVILSTVCFAATANKTPFISSLSQASGGDGASIVISGKNFGNTQNINSFVSFKAYFATNIVSWSDTKIEIIVPSGLEVASTPKRFLGLSATAAGNIGGDSWNPLNYIAPIISLFPISVAGGDTATGDYIPIYVVVNDIQSNKAIFLWTRVPLPSIDQQLYNNSVAAVKDIIGGTVENGITILKYVFGSAETKKNISDNFVNSTLRPISIMVSSAAGQSSKISTSTKGGGTSISTSKLSFVPQINNSSPSTPLKTKSTSIENKNKEQLFFTKLSLSGQKLKTEIAIFDPDKNTTIYAKELMIPTFPVFNYGENNNFQYDPTTQSVYALEVETPDEFETGPCATDNKCYSKILQLNIASANPSWETIFETPKELTDWLVNQEKNTILLSLADAQSNGTEISSFDLKTKKITKVGEINVGYVNHGLVLSKKQNVAFQTVATRENDKWILYLYQIDLDNNKIIKNKIFETITKGSIECYTNISSDEQLVAFYVTDENNHSNLFIYNLKTKSVSQVSYDGEVENNKLVWSEQGRKLLYDLKNKLSYYNFDTGESVDFATGDNLTIYNYRNNKKTSTKELGGFTYNWSPSDRYILYSITSGDDVLGYKEGTYLFDTENNHTISLEGDVFQTWDSSVSDNWYVTE